MENILNLTNVDQLPLPSRSFVITGVLYLIVFFIIIIQLFWKGIGGRGNNNGKKYGDQERLPGLESIPGPFSWDPTGIIGNVIDLLPIEKFLDTNLQWSEKYGDVFKFQTIGQTWVVLNSGGSVQSLCKSTDMGHLMKSPVIYDQAKPFINNGVGQSSGTFWQHQRRILLKSQSYQSLKAYMPMLNKHCKLFVSGIESMFKDGKPHQINGLINSSFIKIICEMITGFDSSSSDECDEYHHNFETMKTCSAYRLLHPWLLLSSLWNRHPEGKRFNKAVGMGLAFAERRIQEHKRKRAEMEAEKTELGGIPEFRPFRSVLDELVDGGVAKEQIVDEINMMIFAGHDTGAGTIHFFCFCIALNPEIQRECQAEVDEMFEDPRSFKNGNVTFEAVTGGLKFVERCIMETLRLFPPGFLFSRKLASPLKINFNNQDVLLPIGTNAILFPFLLHRRPEYFPEPEKFDPDRFLPEECKKRHPYVYIPFSAGPRNCIGMKVAMIEMKIIAAYVLRHFSITTTDRMEDIPLLPYITTTPAKDYTFRFIKRDI